MMLSSKMILRVGRKRHRATIKRGLIWRAAKKRKITKEVVRKQQLSILVESVVNSNSNIWYKIDINIEPFNNKCRVDGSFHYNRHDHTSFDLHRFKSVSPSCLFITPENQILDVTRAAIIGHKVYKLIHTKIMFFDLIDSPTSWLPLPSCPSITPLMMR